LRGARLAAISLLALLFVPAGASIAQQTENPARGQGVGRVGENLSKKSKSMVALDDELSLEIAPAIIAKGDRLKIVPKTGDANALGWLIVTSATSEPPRGKVRGASREIPADSQLEFVLADDEQVNVFLPFIQSMANAFLDNPLKGPLRVAVIDFVNPYGERTQAGDVMLETLARRVCGRPQFECVKREKIVEEMWRLHIPTSRGLDVHTLRAMKKELGAAVIVTGHLRPKDMATVEYILKATSLDGPDEVWRKFEAPLETLGITETQLGRVTVKYAAVSPGLLKFRVANSPKLDGMMADFIGSSDLGGWLTGHEGDGGVVAEPSRHFVIVDGESLVMNPDGNFRERPVAAGERRVKIGYYPHATGSGAPSAKASAPVEKSFDIHVEPGETVEIVILSGITGTRGIIAADLKRIPVL